MKMQLADGEVTREKHAYERGKLETELKQTTKELNSMQNEFNSV